MTYEFESNSGCTLQVLFADLRNLGEGELVELGMQVGVRRRLLESARTGASPPLTLIGVPLMHCSWHTTYYTLCTNWCGLSHRFNDSNW